MKSKPDRSPDFTLDTWHFFFKEMLQYNSNSDILFHIEERGEFIVYYDDHWDRWKRYSDHDIGLDEDEELIFNAYVNWLVEKEILCC